MKKLLSILIFFPLLLNSISSQENIPINIDSLLHFQKAYEIIKWDNETVEKIDSIHRPNYYEGGVLVIKKERKYTYDTIYVSDVTGIDKEKYHAFLSQHWKSAHRDDKRIISYPIRNNCTVSFKETSLVNNFIFRLSNEVIPLGCYPNQWDYEIKEEYINEFPNGLPKKMKIFSYSFPKASSLSLKEWKLVEKHKTNQKLFDDFVYKDAEGNHCYVYPPGYYSNLVDFECEEMDLMVLKVQKALIEKGYSNKITGIMNKETRGALSKFQRDNGLFVSGDGHLIIEYLGIEY